MRITCDLDEEKAKALAHDGSVLVTANPGTGKTHLLTLKYVNLVKSGVNPKDILCLTFTNKAMREMEQRISSELKEQKIEVGQSELNVYTFHSYALDYLDEGKIISTNLLRFVIFEYLKEKEVFNYGDDYLISEIVPKIENLMRYLKSYGVTPDKINKARTKELIEEFERSSDSISKEDLEVFLCYFIEIFGLYEIEKAKKGMDYADLLINFLALKNKPKFKFILVDELQDVNELEARIALESGEQFFAVGDKKQAIFGFQGGSITNFKLFEANKPLIQNLTSNRRSTQEILDFSAEHFKNNTGDEESKRELEGLKSYDDSHGPKPKVIEAESGEKIGKLCSLLNSIDGNVAIVARTNTQIMQIGKELENKNIEFSSTFVASSLEAKENIIKFLKAVFSDDVNDVKNAFFTPFFPITLREAFQLSSNKKLSLEDVLKACPEFKEIRESQKDTQTVSRLFRERIFPLCIPYGREYVLAAQSLLDSSQEALNLLDEKTLDSFSRYLQVTDLAASTAKKDAKITLTTVHKAKGLQYDTVIYLPKKTRNKRSFYDYIVEKILEANGEPSSAELEEDALRIDFVAFTRAKKELFLIVDKARDYSSDASEIMQVEPENTGSSFEEKQKRAYALFINKNYDDAQKLLEEDASWLKEFVENYFKGLDRVSFSALTPSAYEYFTRNILGLSETTYATSLGSSVHNLLANYLNQRLVEPSEEEKLIFDNGVALIEGIKKDYPEFVEAECELKVPIKTIVSTQSELNFKAFVDAVFKNQDEYLIVDWKTSKDNKNASVYRRQLELYKRAYAQARGIPLEKIRVAIGFVGLRKIINDGNCQAEVDGAQPRSSAFKTIQKHLERFLGWQENPETFFQELLKTNADDPLFRSIVEQYKKEA
ncbi:hypothetical protein AUJ65_04520 [Candidatus Micrarchaeota archaeon CG1_02_51_15]|nr:MAG: hypothetical protein AUJ65_04520 [Candidatus Micrarchaeota archaeon CG1_02_51_15]